jgi:hypothetical protein
MGILIPKSVRVGIDESEVVMIIDGNEFVKMPSSHARQVAAAILRNCDLLETGRIVGGTHVHTKPVGSA